MAIIKGDKIVFAIRFTDDASAEQTLRVLYQTSGGRSISRDEIDISTKDIDGTAYGAKEETISIEGLMSTDDPALERLKEDIRRARYAEILEINIDTLEAEVGTYMLSSLDFEYPDEESATYSFEAKLIGETEIETLTEVPTGATTI